MSAAPRIVVIHAHPDDETLFTGGLLVAARRLGAEVTLLTATLGEEGEVFDQRLSPLTAEFTNQLGGFRFHELSRARAAVGLDPFPQLLGGVGGYRDSGMAGSPAARHPRAFTNHHTTPREQIQAVIERVRPHLVVTYAADGGYGHPDHIHCHELTVAALRETSVRVPAVAWATRSTRDLDAAREAIGQLGQPLPEDWKIPAPGQLAGAGEECATMVSYISSADVSRLEEALRAHATQLEYLSLNQPLELPTGNRVLGLYALTNRLVQPLLEQEYYTLDTTWSSPALAAVAQSPAPVDLTAVLSACFLDTESSDDD